jgi:hypothetical protein
MTKPKKRAATVHFDLDVWGRVEQLAADQRRPISHLIRNLVEDAVAGHSSGGNTSARTGMVSA